MTAVIRENLGKTTVSYPTTAVNSEPPTHVPTSSGTAPYSDEMPTPEVHAKWEVTIKKDLEDYLSKKTKGNEEISPIQSPRVTSTKKNKKNKGKKKNKNKEKVNKRKKNKGVTCGRGLRKGMCGIPSL